MKLGIISDPPHVMGLPDVLNRRKAEVIFDAMEFLSKGTTITLGVLDLNPGFGCWAAEEFINREIPIVGVQSISMASLSPRAKMYYLGLLMRIRRRGGGITQIAPPEHNNYVESKSDALLVCSTGKDIPTLDVIARAQSSGKVVVNLWEDLWNGGTDDE